MRLLGTNTLLSTPSNNESAQGAYGLSMRHYLFLILTLAACIQARPVAVSADPEGRTVVLLHGLVRSSASMRKMEKALVEEGFHTCNIDYPSRKHGIEVLAREYILPQIRDCTRDSTQPIDFVSHSMGGILVRYLAEYDLVPDMGRVVMLSPPNQGSELVDKFGDNWLFDLVNGPAGNQLGTDSSSVPLQLGPADFELGIITGSRSINGINSMIISGKDDGKVSIERAKLDGMKAFLVLPATHSFIMSNSAVIDQTIYFLKNGEFDGQPSLGLN
ncbi:MAG: triacylglycerol lipase [Rhodothermales bacterium]